MKTIAVHSTKGGTGKTTLSILLLNALSGAGFRCLAVDTDTVNHSLSFYLNGDLPYELIYQKNIYTVFAGETVADNALKINERIDLLHADVRLADFRGTERLKRFRKALAGLDYDYVIIDTAPSFDNVIVNIFNSSDTLVIPVCQDVFNYQSLKYLFEKLSDMEVAGGDAPADSALDIHIVFNQYQEPRTENKQAYGRQLQDLFTEDELFRPFINPCQLSRSALFRKYINDFSFRLNGRVETRKQYEEAKALIERLTGVEVGEAI
jgi:chromosome partitioning protein